MQRIIKNWGLRLALLLAFLIPLISVWAGAADKDEERKLLEDFKTGNHIVLLRHALAPGTGDPDNFILGDCTTQRNLSQAGRDQAVRIGNRFKQAGITNADVYTSEWCRCLETAELLGLNTPVPLPSLNSFFRNYDRQAQQTEVLHTWLAAQQLDKPLILVTHQVNITAFSNIYPDSGEVVLMRRNADNKFEVAGSIRTE
ncbi:MAG: histidine phosphatase family protein [Desulfocapsaceae bacterium]